MSVSLLLGLVYLISELLLTYSTSSRHGGQAKAGSGAPLAQTFFASGASHRDPATDFSRATRLSLQLLISSIVSGLR
jgi:hypothetical protein